MVKNLSANTGDTGDSDLILGLERSPRVVAKDRGAWHATVHGAAKSQTRLSN